MYERIVEQVTSRFGLAPDKAKQLLGMLIGVIFNAKRGGPAGLLQSFRDKGMGDVIGSWIGHGPNQAISPGQLEDVLGSDTLAAMSDKLGLPRDTVASAGAAMLPDAVDSLSEHGELPLGVTDRLKGWFGDTFDEMGHWGTAALGASAAVLGAGATSMDIAAHRVGDVAHEATRAVEAGLHRAGDAVGGDAGEVKPVGGKLWPWLLFAAALIGAFLIFRSCQRQEAAPATTPAATTVGPVPATPAAQFDSRLVLTRTGDKLTYDGVVDSEASKAAILEALTTAFGAGNVSGNIAVDANARTPGWLAALAGFLPQFTANGATLTFEGSKVDLSGDVADADKAGLLAKLKAAFGGFSFGGMFEGLGAAAERSVEAAAAALEKLAPGKFSASDLVKALNLMIVHFDSDSANISADSDAILKKAAAAIKAAPAGTRIEVGGHTDNTGNAAANQTLSQQRAEAVKARLEQEGVAAEVLTAKGYGQDKPVADNSSDDGRAQNRRIEFTVL
jgi:OOP family OmpA-OmpF porin